MYEGTFTTDNPRVIADAITRSIEKISIGISELIHSNLTADPRDGGTPVHSGFASASWICSIGEPTTQVGGLPGRPNRGPSESSIIGLQVFRLEKGFIWITNNSTYILELNSGSSKQARPGFIDSAIIRAVNNFGTK